MPPVRVLHVDDDEGFRELTARFLERAAGEFDVVSETEAGAVLDRLAGDATGYLQRGRGNEQYDLLANRIRNAVERYHGRRERERSERFRRELYRITSDTTRPFEANGQGARGRRVTARPSRLAGAGPRTA